MQRVPKVVSGKAIKDDRQNFSPPTDDRVKAFELSRKSPHGADTGLDLTGEGDELPHDSHAQPPLARRA